MADNIYAEVMRELHSQESISIQTVFSGEAGDLKKDLIRSLVPVEKVQDSEGLLSAKAGCVRRGDRTIVTEPVFPQQRPIILGGGHVASHLCRIAAGCDYRIIVCDDRPAFASKERFPGAEEVLCDTFKNCLDSLKITSCDSVVIVTRGHRHDAECLQVILPGTEPAYTGMIGSRRRVRGLFDRLEEEGFSRQRMDRICTPIGLNIGAVTPQEIAVSILAELIAYRRLPEHARGRLCISSDLTLDIVEYLSKDDSPKAIVTVIETNGSTPRRAGAKMAVSPWGGTTGTIGGGCGEGKIIREAVGIIGTGTFRVCTVDMTGDPAGEEGMVCGGTMKMLIEDGTESAG